MTPKAIALCIEDLDASPQRRFLVCTALIGHSPGLGLDPRGEVTWQRQQDRVVELWVSMDQQLILYRRPDGPPTEVHRGGRSLQVPEEKPVVLLHLDEIRIDQRRLRVHLHGQAKTIAAPQFFAPPPPPSASKKTLNAVAAATAAALSLGAVACQSSAATEPTPPVEVRPHPPAPMPPEWPQPEPDVVEVTAPEPIEVREAPPEAPIDEEEGPQEEGDVDPGLIQEPPPIEVRPMPPTMPAPPPPKKDPNH